MIIFFSGSQPSNFREITAIPMSQVTKISVLKNLIRISYYDGDCKVNLNGQPIPELKVVVLHYTTDEVAYDQMREFYSALSKDRKVFFFEVM